MCFMCPHGSNNCREMIQQEVLLESITTYNAHPVSTSLMELNICPVGWPHFACQRTVFLVPLAAKVGSRGEK